MRFGSLLVLGLLTALVAPPLAFAKGRAVAGQKDPSKVLVPVGEEAPPGARKFEVAPVDPNLHLMAPDLKVEILAPTQEVGPALAKISNTTRTDVTTPFNVKANVRAVCGGGLETYVSKPIVLELGGGETEFVAVKPTVEYWPDVGCQYRMTVQVDTKNAVTETNEHNNRALAVFCPMDDGEC